MEDFLTVFTFALGLLTCILSLIISHAFYEKSLLFKGDAKTLSRAIQWQLIGEAIIGGGTLVFTTAAFFDVLSSWPVEMQSCIRIFMFLATSITTVHLYRVIRKIKL